MTKSKPIPEYTFQQPAKILNKFVDELFVKTIFQSSLFLDNELSPSHIKLLFAFSKDDLSYSIGELGKNAGINKSTMTNIVDSLEKDGMVERLRDSKDRRVVLIRLSSKGKRKKGLFISRAAKQMQSFFSKLEQADREKLLYHVQEAYAIVKKI